MHFVIDKWFEIKKVESEGTAEFVRYADDIVFFFQYKREAEKFYKELKERLEMVGLRINEEKSRLIKFSRYKSETDTGRKETFDFLGFTHYIGNSLKGFPRLKRKTSIKTLKSRRQTIKHWIKSVRSILKFPEICKKLRIKLLGHYRYYGITDNSDRLNDFYQYTVMQLFKWMNRRSQKKSFTWEKFYKYLKLNPLPYPRIYVNVMS